MIFSMSLKKSPSNRAEHFQKARLQRLSELAEDYTELIDELIAENGKARISDLAREMGVSHVSVIKMIQRLIRNGYLMGSDVHPLILLTPKGKEMASFSKKKHQILAKFLQKLGVAEDIAAADVEGIEHHISPSTLQALEAHLDWIKSLK